MQDGNEPENCFKRKYPIGLDPCCHYWKEDKEQFERIKEYLYIPDHLKSNSFILKGNSKSVNHNVPSIETDKTEIYGVHGTFDSRTRFMPALKEFARIKAPIKRKFILVGGGHCVAFRNSCRSKIMNEIFNNGSKDETDECINNLNIKDDSWHSWKEVDDLNLWAKDQTSGNDGNLNPLPNRPFNE